MGTLGHESLGEGEGFFFLLVGMPKGEGGSTGGGDQRKEDFVTWRAEKKQK